ncbi:hypothetical protein [Marinithermus hydrothermalis]|uniref:TPR repeat-containing protein n=1 Tax=Marinithermus hydrothermalis (strain DSM 14884 / JCM 11576 / T1) TaxID=869210 RepID=F2NPU0_MARHT|nr:hypothetical protein [Marinithermus hydrothermalis]AEB12866.1 TPR repeat-containing protein [Marinithermus hydrothermalis DSM 14884]
MGYRVPKTRLLPPRTPHEVARSRVLERLFHLWEHSPAVVLAAPAGYGKSTLLAPLAAVWVTLGAEARDPVVFGWHLAAAYRAHADTRLAEQRLEVGDWVGAVEALTEAAAALEPHLLVLDEAERAPVREGAAALQTLLKAPGLRLAVASRRSAPWEVLGTVVGPQTLRFDLEEALQLAQALGTGLAAFEVERAWSLVEGWPLGLRVVLRAAARGALPEAALFAPPEPESISAYLLAGLDARTADLAARAAVLGEVGPEEAPLLGGDPAPLFAHAEDLLLERVGRRLRFPPLVRAALARLVPEDEARALLARAAEAALRRGHALEAAGYLLEARRYAEAAALLAREGTAWLEQGLAYSVLAILERIPRELRAAQAGLVRLEAEALRQVGRYGEAERAYREAVRLGEARALLGLVRLYLDTVEPAKARPYLEQAARRFPDEEVRPLLAENALNAGRVTEALRLGMSGPRALLRSGRVGEALERLRRHEEAPPPRPPKNHREGLLLLALLEAVAGEAEAALEAAGRGRTVGERMGSPFVVALAEARRGHALLALSRWEAAGAAYRHALALAEGGPARLAVEALAGLGALGDRRAFEQALRLARESGDAWVEAFLSLMVAYAHLRRGEAFPPPAVSTEDPFLAALAAAYPWTTGDAALLRRYPFLERPTLFAPPPERARRALWEAGRLDVPYHPGVRVEVRALGGFAVRVDGRPARFRREKARLLLALLVARSWTKDALIEALGVSSGEFRVLWSELLGVLEPGRPKRVPGYFLTPYRLVPRPELRVDLWELNARPEAYLGRFAEPFGGLDHPALDAARAEVTAHYREALLARGTPEALLEALRLEPLDEAVLERIAALGDRALFARAVALHRQALAELGF